MNSCLADMEVFEIASLALVALFILDFILGDPKWLPHPVILMGKIISNLEKTFNGSNLSRLKRKISGIILAVFLPLASFFLSAVIIWLSCKMEEVIGMIVTIILGFTTIAARGLKDAAYRVGDALNKEDIPVARDALSRIVGRSTNELDKPEIARAAVETVAENTSDGVIAPLFYLFIGGVPLAMAYKAINTLDSMTGYKNDRYKEFGWGSARLDDIANFIPARLTAFLIIAAAFLLNLDWKGSWQIMIRDCRNHPSPNAGWPESAAAGALGIRLGGINHYPGRTEERPFIGDDSNVLGPVQIEGVVRIMYLSATLMLIGILFLKEILSC
ncbi:MAG: adenosylcobinamide-phosphate synthase CbiB [bacterium]|nr:adenosylcobinamide-phosphate synthase CbiB [bacterium]